VLDMTGLSQKGGSVMSHLIIANKPQDICSMHVAHGAADLIIGGDLVVCASEKVMSTASCGKTHAVVNSYELMSGEFTRVRDLKFPGSELADLIRQHTGAESAAFVNANYYAENLFGNTICANFFLIGIAVQQGLVPIPPEAIEKAIELNGRSVDMNRLAFRRGRQFVVDPGAIDRMVESRSDNKVTLQIVEPETVDDVISNRSRLLIEYQDKKYADRYRDFVESIRAIEQCLSPGAEGVTGAVARSYYKLLAYKDEYEVARMLSASEFRAGLEAEFSGDFYLQYHLAPPVLAKKDPVSGLPVKRTYGPWMGQALRLIAKFKFLRGTPFDPFGRSDDRRLERKMIEQYESVVQEAVSGMNAANHGIVEQIVSYPESVRGFGHIKKKSYHEAMAHLDDLMKAFRASSLDRDAA